MDVVITLLRIVHIFAAIFWAGVTFFTLGILEPTVKSAGPEGARFMQRLAAVGGMSRAMGIAGAVVVLSGLLLYGPITGNLNPAVVFGGRLGLTLGAIAGLAAGVSGFVIQGRTSGQLARLGAQIAGQGQPPSPEQAAQLGAMQARLSQGTMISAVLMAIAVIGMSV